MVHMIPTAHSNKTKLRGEDSVKEYVWVKFDNQVCSPVIAAKF